MNTKPIIVITGATSGIGLLSAIEIAKQGGHLVLTARNQSKAEYVNALLKKSVPKVKVDFFFGDLSIMKDVVRMGSEISNSYDQINVLINNAGIHAFEQRITVDGYPEMIAVNYFAPWLLTQTLKSNLIKSKNSRIVNVASEASRNHGILLLPNDLTDTKPFTARGSSQIYGKTKLLDIMFTAELSRQFSESDVTVNALNPGFNVTGLGRELWFSNIVSKILNLFHIGDPNRGANIIIHLATDPVFKDKKGLYFSGKNIESIKPIDPGSNVELQKKLWKETENILSKYLLA